MRNPITSIRMGPATNSSSSHSIIIRKKNDKLVDTFENSNYGWYEFLAISKKEKLRYIHSALKANLESLHKLDTTESIMLAAHYMGLALDELKRDPSDPLDSSIDHQSQFIIPLDLSSNNQKKVINKQFLKELTEYITQENIGIVGGNDNENSKFKKYQEKFRINLPLDEYISDDNFYIARKDTGGWWTLFNPSNGTKIRTNFKENIDTPKLANIPELVDLKITDYCSFGCQYCYQGSTTTGKHGEEDYLYSAIRELTTNGVFEIAIGGGEPTQFGLHNNQSRLSSILYANSHYTNVNFTTRNLGWFIDNELPKRTSVAISVDAFSEVKKISNFIQKFNLDREKFKIQYVHGLGILGHVWDQCNDEGLDLTILGWKTTGRGQNKNTFVNSYSKDELITLLERVKVGSMHANISIDTVLAEEFKNELKKNKIPDYLYETQDGRYSCYIDGVAQTVNISSYEGNPGLNLKNKNGFFNFKDFQDKFNTLQKTIKISI